MNTKGAGDNMVTDEMIMNRIYVLRGQKVMIDTDLASLYKIETGRLRTLAEKNASHFPGDFMFVLRPEDYSSLKQQDSSVKRAAIVRRMPAAFTEQGLAMLSGLVKSERAVVVNIRIIRIFTMIRQLLPDYPELTRIMDQFKSTLICHK